MKRSYVFATAFVLSLAFAGTVVADDNWNKNHPRRHQVNKRLDNQNKRINEKEREGKISPAEAKKLHKEDRQIRREERAMASQNGGHITKQEQRTLNQQENKVSGEIGK